MKPLKFGGGITDNSGISMVIQFNLHQSVLLKCCIAICPFSSLWVVTRTQSFWKYLLRAREY